MRRSSLYSHSLGPWSASSHLRESFQARTKRNWGVWVFSWRPRLLMRDGMDTYTRRRDGRILFFFFRSGGSTARSYTSQKIVFSFCFLSRLLLSFSSRIVRGSPLPLSSFSFNLTYTPHIIPRNSTYITLLWALTGKEKEFLLHCVLARVGLRINEWGMARQRVGVEGIFLKSKGSEQ